MTKLINPYIFLRSKDYNYKYIDINLYNLLKDYDFESKKDQIKTQSRSSTITPIFQNVVVSVYNGKKYIPFRVTKDYFGHKFGEFIFTRRNIVHKKQNQKLVVKKKNYVSKELIKSKFKVHNISALYLQKKYLLNEKKT